MSTDKNTVNQSSLDELYAEASYWHVNTGDEIIHAKRMGGHFRTLKWWAWLVWLPYFAVPYFRWDDRQAILLDIPNRNFHFLNITIMPQDVWLLALVLLFFSILLAAVTSLSGRVFCGYFCFQTIWTDLFTLIEEKLEGPPTQRRKLDKAPWNAYKIKIKTIKHISWLLIGALTGIAFISWFTDAYQLWTNIINFETSFFSAIVILTFTLGTYILAGHMREQTCFWLCPYARIQGVMYDTETILPTYDERRGEPRGKLKRDLPADNKGDCIACNQCVAVCPTGIDIRHGQQEGCITCALCIDACDAVMDKIGKPRGLIRYASLDDINGKPKQIFIKRPRVMVYLVIIIASVCGLLYGVNNLGTFDLKVIHERQPMFVLMSDGSIQNKYNLKIVNKTAQDMNISIVVEGPTGLQTQGLKEKIKLPANKLSSFIIFVRIPKNNLTGARTAVNFRVQSFEVFDDNIEYLSIFFGPEI